MDLEAMQRRYMNYGDDMEEPMEQQMEAMRGENMAREGMETGDAVMENPEISEGDVPMEYQENVSELPTESESRRMVFPGNNFPETPIAPEGGRPVFPGDNIPETPIAPEGGRPVFPGDNIPETPIAPEGGRPVFPGDNIPETPIAPEGGRPVFPGDNIPETPIAPEGGRPVNPGMGPGPVIIPVRPQNRDFSRVRFLNASTNNFPLQISIDGRAAVQDLRFGENTGYQRVTDGFHTVTIVAAVGPRILLYRKALPFVANEVVTMVVIDTPNGLDIAQVSDRGCRALPGNISCFRVANMSYDNSAYDVMLYNGGIVFADVRFQAVTRWKQARTADYQFYVTNARRGQRIEEIPMITMGNGVAYEGIYMEPLTSFQVDMSAGEMYTSYLIGNPWSAASFRVVTLAGE